MTKKQTVSPNTSTFCVEDLSSSVDTSPFGIDARLSCVAGFVREGAVLADVGTDHAYLPISLARIGRISSAYATDINPEPLKRACENIQKHKLSQTIKCVLADGLCTLYDKGITDITICGMGGRLICNIIERAEFVKSDKIRLIVQPMTEQAFVRKFLLANGFDIRQEALILSDRQLYHIICAEYDGILREYTDVELELGRLNINGSRGKPFYTLLKKRITNEKNIISGKKQTGADRSENEARLSYYTALLREKTNEK